jgi:PAS domain S-box-containing protein
VDGSLFRLELTIPPTISTYRSRALNLQRNKFLSCHRKREAPVQETEFPWVNEMIGVLETINQGVIINDDCSHIVFANKLFQKMMGMPAEELIGRKVMDMYPPEDAAILRNHIQQRQTEGQSQYEFYLPQANGNRLPVLVTARQIEDPDGNRAEARRKCSP